MSPIVSTSAKTNVYSRTPSTMRVRQAAPPNGSEIDWLAIVRLPEEGGDDAASRRLLARDLRRDLALAEDEHAVHQLDMLVDLRREHHDRTAGTRYVDEHAVAVLLRADV